MNTNSIPCPPAAVIFDMDGVICDTREHHLQAFQELMELYERDLSAEEFQSLFGMENRKLIPHLFGEELTEEQILDRADWKESRYRELIAKDIKLMEGVQDLMDWLTAKGLPFAVASSAPRDNVEQVLRSTGVIDRVATYLSSEDVSEHKPHPEMFLTAAQRMGVEPSQTWVIEDSLHGINAGLAAGMPVIAVATTHSATELAPATVVYEDMSKVAEMAKGCGEAG